MRSKLHPIRTSNAYLRAIPFIFMFQMAVNLVIGAIAYVLRQMAMGALFLKGRVAVTTGDFTFLFTSWQGWVVIVLGLAMLYLYIALELFGTVAYAKHWVAGERTTIREVLREGIASTRNLLNPFGLLVVIYVAILGPLLGAGSSVSLTAGLRIPSFIMSVVDATPIFKAIHTVLVALAALVGFLGVFVPQCIVFDDMPAWDAYKRSISILKENLVNYIFSMLLFNILMVMLGLVIVIALPPVISAAIGAAMQPSSTRVISVLLYLLIGVFGTFDIAVGPTFSTLKHSRLYRKYEDGVAELPVVPGRSGWLPFAAMSLLVMGLCVPLSFVIDEHFDELFPKSSDVAVIAHRACGEEGPENTAEGLEAAVNAGAWGAEIDIQRTADGAYVVNHDDNFKRVAGEARAPQEMTLEEIKQLEIRNPDGTPTGVHVSTYEQMLEGSRGRLKLFVELKGKTADRQMADDAVRIARDMGMLDQCVFISLKYDLIKYLEDTYPDVETGFLEFASFGSNEKLECDYLAMEEELASSVLVDDIHEQGKKVLVWTANSKDSQKHFLMTKCDAIITDRMTQASQVRTELETEDDIVRAGDYLFQNLFR